MAENTEILRQPMFKTPMYMGDFDPERQGGYNVMNQVSLFGCVWESKNDNNTTAPAVWDGGDTITPNTQDWKQVSGDYEAWLINKDKPATTGTTGAYPYNGMGRVVLKKNMVSGVNTLTQSMMQSTNTIYVIQYDFTVEGTSENIPLNFTSSNVSGVMTPEKIELDAATAAYDEAAAAYDADPTPENLAIKEKAQKRKEKAQARYEAIGSQNYYYWASYTIPAQHCLHLTGRAVQLNDSKNAQVATEYNQGVIYAPSNESLTVYVGNLAGQYSYLKDGYVRVPANCVLEFDGGSINGNGTGKNTITCNRTIIKGRKCFNCNLVGTVFCNVFKVSWFNVADYTSVFENFRIFSNTIGDYATLDIDLDNARLYVDCSLFETWTCSHLKINGNNNTVHITGAGENAAFNFTSEDSNSLIIDKCNFFCDANSTQVPIFLFAGYSGITFKDCYFQNCGTGVQMGTNQKPAYGLTLYHTSATIANIGKPFIKLVYGAGFTWNTHDGISHNEAAVPAKGQPMNTVAGTNAVDIVGPWDSADINIFCEKLYRGINIDPQIGMAAGAIYYIKVHDCIFDYMKDSAICANQTVDIANNHFTIENNYIWCYVTDDIHVDGIYLYGGGSHIDHAVIKNNNIIQATRSIVTGAFNTVMFDTDIEENLLSGEIYLLGLSKGVVKNNRTNGAFVYIIHDDACIIGNIAREYNVQNHTTSYVKNNVMTIYDDYREWNP